MTAKQVRDRIRKLGLKKQHVAKKIGVSITTLSYYLNEKRNLEVNAKEKLRLYLEL
ncbi:MAG: helix-turn-helix domain-containing protein [Bacteroidales bacterium]|jgi:predicted transcriptional regulator|nr:helix-turn-helix domain-containing protein [Bacteroidales bacterium]